MIYAAFLEYFEKSKLCDIPQSKRILILLFIISKCDEAPSIGKDRIVWIVNFIISGNKV